VKDDQIHDSLNEIGREFKMQKYSSISSVIERLKKQMLTDRNLKKRIERVADRVNKSQGQTWLLCPDPMPTGPSHIGRSLNPIWMTMPKLRYT